MDNGEFVDFKKIREYITITEIPLFTTYLKEVFKDLADRAESSKKKGISRITFYDYMKLPVLIAEKLYNALDVDSDGFLSSKEFVEGVGKLYLGDFEQTIEIIFAIFDFDKDGVINKGDVKVILSYLPLKTDKTKVEYKYQMDSLQEIDEILSHTFPSNKDSMKLAEFIKVVENKKSDVFLQILCFLYQRKPFSDENINMLKVYRRQSANDLNSLSNEKQFLSPQHVSKRLPSPSRKTVFSPAHTFLKLNLLSNVEEPAISGIKGMLRMPNEKIAKKKKGEEDIKSMLKNSENVYNSPSNFFKSGPKSDFNLEDNLVKMEEFNLDDNNEHMDGAEDNTEKKVMKEDWIYKLSESLKLKKYWLVLMGKDIYYYKNEKKEELLGMHNLSGCFVKDNGEKKIGEEKMFSFGIQFTGKTRNYYCSKKANAVEWTKNLKESIGYLSFFDYYEMLDDIGEGKFGLVKLGVHKNTKQRVAIKIIKKESMTNPDIELVKSEIDIMKLCKHPNVVRLLDHFENAEYIFIIMEYLPGGDLGEYLTKTKYKTSEERASKIMFEMGSGICYLHQYGVVHRDLKPENVMLTECSEKGTIKVMDFGLSKIMGPQERLADGFGTLSFVAPEVLIRQPYNKQIDIWSLGVIMYFMLSGTLPFDDENDNEEVIAKMTVFVEVQFPVANWGKRSSSVIDLISQCLIKDPEKRISIDNFLKHDWIQKHNN